MKKCKKAFSLISLCVIICLLFSGCDFKMVDIPMNDKDLAALEVRPISGYYLASDGTLYSRGADSDASAFVCYQDAKKGIVAENVRSFGTMLCGGYLVTNNNSLYIWNRDKIPLYNYEKNKTLCKIADNVKTASVSKDMLFYTDLQDNLYFAGTYEETDLTVNISNAKLLAENGVYYYPCLPEIVWIEKSGKISSCSLETGKSQVVEYLESLSIDPPDENIRIQTYNNSVLFLEHGKLRFFGDYDELVGKSKSGILSETVLLENVIEFSLNDGLLIAIDSNHVAYAWGECLANGKDNTEEPVYERCEKTPIIDQVKYVYVSDKQGVCFIGCDGRTKSFANLDGWTFFGDSVENGCIGIHNDPVVWTK